jgi:phage terminase large subunit
VKLQVDNYTIEYDYGCVPTVADFANSDKKIRCIMGCIGSGKSSGCVMEIVRRGLEQSPSKVDGIRKTRWAIIRQTYRQLIDTTIKTFHQWFPAHIFGEWKISEHSYTISKFPNTHIEILFRALDSPEHISNLLSMELTGAWINEAREINKEIFDILEGRVGRFPSRIDGGCSWSGIIMDTNPPDNTSWLYHYFEELKPEKAQIFKQPSGLSKNAENIQNLPTGYYQDLAVGKSEDYVNVYIHGNYGYSKTGKPVYTNFNSDLHIAKEELIPNKNIPIIIGMDFGLNVSAIICQLTPRGQFLVLDEIVSEGIGIRSFINNRLKPLLNIKYKGFSITGCGDPAGVQRSQTNERTCFEELQNAGLKIVPAKTNSLAGRLDAVENLLNRLVDGKACFQVSPSCKVLIDGFLKSYRYKRMRVSGEKYMDVPEKNTASHVHDSLQYAALYVDEYENLGNINYKKMYVRKHTYIPASVAGY